MDYNDLEKLNKIKEQIETLIAHKAEIERESERREKNGIHEMPPLYLGNHIVLLDSLKPMNTKRFMQLYMMELDNKIASKKAYLSSLFVYSTYQPFPKYPSGAHSKQ